MTNMPRVIDSYLNWIKDNTYTDTLGNQDYFKVTVPFLDRNNDHLEIYVKEQGGNFILSDDGYTINDLENSGLDINTPKREQIFKTTVNGYGIKVGENFSLFTEATPSNIGQKKHYLIQAMLAVNDMYALAQENVWSLFKEDVEMFFKTEDIIYSKDIKITGKTGFDHNIDFIIPKSKQNPERLIKSLNIAKKESAMNSIFAFSDISDIRGIETKNFVIYNDVAHSPNPEVIDAFKNYNVVGVPWTQRQTFKSQFAIQ